MEDIFPKLLRDDRDADRWQARGAKEGFVSRVDALVHAAKVIDGRFVRAYCPQFETVEGSQRVRVFGVIAGHRVCRECVREIEKGLTCESSGS